MTPEDVARAIADAQEGMGARPRGNSLGVFAALLIVAVTFVLLAFPLGIASACAWWLFTAGWDLIA